MISYWPPISPPNCNNEQKIIFEYRKLFSSANKERKNKNWNWSLNIYNECLNWISSLNTPDKLCETHFYIGLVSFKWSKVQESFKHFIWSDELIDYWDPDLFPLYKIKGKIIAYWIHWYSCLNDFDNCAEYIRSIFPRISKKYSVEIKLLLFHHFIKEWLYPINKGRKFAAFWSDYSAAQNDILYNGKSQLNSRIKSTFSNWMSTATRDSLFDKNNILFYINKYSVTASNPIITFFEKNADLFRDSALSVQKIKLNWDAIAKANKIKIDKEFNSTAIDWINERKTRIENFSKIFNDLTLTFTVWFKNHIQANHRNGGVNTIPKTSANMDSAQQSPEPRIKQNHSNVSHNMVWMSHHESEGEKPQTANTQVKKNGNCNGNGSGNGNGIRYSWAESRIPNWIRWISDDKLGHKNMQSLNTINVNVNVNVNKPKTSFWIFENYGNEHKYKHDQTNTFAENRVVYLINSVNDSALNTILRNYNRFWFDTIIEDLTNNKGKKESDWINMKINSYVSSYSSLSTKGKHIVYGDFDNENQDVCFIYENFMWIKNWFLFGVWDGHGLNGHKVSEFGRINIPAHWHYIELDNNMSKRNKSINSIIATLYSWNEKSTIKEMHIWRYFYEKFKWNYSEISLVKSGNKAHFNEIGNIIKEAFKRTQDSLKKNKKYDTDNSGSTVCSLVLNGKTLIVSNLGDSRAVLWSSIDGGNYNWKAAQLTKDHKPTDPDEQKRIQRCNGYIHRCTDEDGKKEIGPYRVWFKDDTKGPGWAMSRSWGDNLSKEIGVSSDPDIVQYELTEHDKCIIVGSDGWFEFLSHDNIKEIVRSMWIWNADAAEICEVWTKKSTEKWKEHNSKSIDDISVVCFVWNVPTV